MVHRYDPIAWLTVFMFSTVFGLGLVVILHKGNVYTSIPQLTNRLKDISNALFQAQPNPVSLKYLW